MAFNVEAVMSCHDQRAAASTQFSFRGPGRMPIPINIIMGAKHLTTGSLVLGGLRT